MSRSGRASSSSASRNARGLRQKRHAAARVVEAVRVKKLPAQLHRARRTQHEEVGFHIIGRDVLERRRVVAVGKAEQRDLARRARVGGGLVVAQFARAPDGREEHAAQKRQRREEERRAFQKPFHPGALLRIQSR